MKLVKVKKEFYDLCITNGADSELLYNEQGRPCVLIIHISYKLKKYKFAMPLRSNISNRTPRWQYFSLPPNSNTKPGNSHGIHYIKLFPIKDEYIDSYEIIDDPYMIMIKEIIDGHEKEIIDACRKYLEQCEKGSKHSMTPDIDGILNWLY